MPRRLIRSTKSKIAESVGPLTEVRRHGWLHDYHMELDQGPDRSITSAGPDPYQHDRLMQRAADRGECVPPAMPSNQAPVVVNVNINLGDILSRLALGKATASECLEEMVRSGGRRPLNESVNENMVIDRLEKYARQLSGEFKLVDVSAIPGKSKAVATFKDRDAAKKFTQWADLVGADVSVAQQGSPPRWIATCWW